MVFALTTGHKIGLLVVGLAFIVFALVSSFVLPRRNPNFPGRGVGGFVALSALFFVAMIAAVLVFGKESKGENERGGAGGEPTEAVTQAAQKPGESGNAGKYANGDAAAGKTVFTSAGCSGCHTLKAANASGNVGPNLDDAKPDQALIVKRVTLGKGPMPPFKGQLSDKQISDVVAFVYSSTHS